MAPPYRQTAAVFKPETALKRAEELINVGQPLTALINLHEWVVSKKYRQYSETQELLMIRLIGLAVDQQRGRLAKEALHAYKNMVLNTSIQGLESVVLEFLRLSEAKVDQAQVKADKLTLDLIEDLEAIETPESIMLRTVSGKDTRDRTDREVVTPWLKFQWETYRTLLDVLKNNVKLEALYHIVAKKAFQFCLKFSRKTELRRLCEILRQHLQNVSKYGAQTNSIDLTTPESMRMHLDTRFMQLDVSSELELWQEAFRSVEDIFFLMAKNSAQPAMLLDFYEKLIQMFLVSRDFLFHAAGWSKYFTFASRQQDFTVEKRQKFASIVMISALAVPVFSSGSAKDDDNLSDEVSLRSQRLSQVLGLSGAPSRSSLITEALNRNLLKHASPEVKELYQIFELQFHPLTVTKRVQPVMEKFQQDPEMVKYVEPLYQVIMARILQQLSNIYTTVKFDFVLSLASFPQPYAYSKFDCERIILNACKRGDLVAHIDHSSASLIFESNPHSKTNSSELKLGVSPSEKLRVQLTELASRLKHIRFEIGDLEVEKENVKLLKQLTDQFQREREAMLVRREYLEKKREFTDNLLSERDRQEAAERQSRAQKEAEIEQARLAEESRRRELERIKREHDEIERQQAQKLADEMAKKNLKIDVEHIENLDKDKLMRLQIEHYEAEKSEQEAKLKAVTKFIDHTERAFRKVEIPLIAKSYELQKKKDFEHHEEAHKLLLEATKRQHAVDITIKNKMKRIANDVQAFKASREDQFKEVRAKLLEESQKKIAEAKEARIAELRATKQQELEEKQVEGERLRLEAETNVRLEAGMISSHKSDIVLEQVAKEAARSKGLKAEKEEREKQMVEAAEKARMQLQREEEAERNRERRLQERLTGGSTQQQESQASSELDWTVVRGKAAKPGSYIPPMRKDTLSVATPPTPAETPAKPISTGPKKYVPPSARK